MYNPLKIRRIYHWYGEGVMKKIVVLDGYALNPGDLSWKRLEEIGSVRVYDRTEEKEVEKRVDGCEIVITNKTLITRELLSKNPQIKYVGVLATGYNVVDIEAAREYGVVVTNIPTFESIRFLVSPTSVAMMAQPQAIASNTA